MGQGGVLALVVVLQHVAQCVRGVQQHQHRVAASGLVLRWLLRDGLHTLPVFLGQQGDALMLQQVHARRPARTRGHMGQQAGVLDGDVFLQAEVPLLQVL